MINHNNNGIYNSFPAYPIYPTTPFPSYPTIPSFPTINVQSIGSKFAPVEAGVKNAHVVLVVDESGSMEPVKDATISAVNEYIANQRIDAIFTKTNTHISVFTFDGYNVKRIIDKVDVLATPTINTYNYNPVGMTNLNDAFGGVIATINEEMKVLPLSERPTVVITVMTDGHENSSRTFGINDVNEMVGKCKNQKWAFMFLGANIDAFSVGASYGFSKSNSMNYSNNAAGLSGTLSAATRMTNSVKHMRSLNADATMETVYNDVGFTDVERTTALKGNE